MEIAIHRFQLRLALSFETNAALDKFRAEAMSWQLVNLWPAVLDPIQLESWGVVGRNGPRDLDPAAGDRQSAVFSRIG